jgi:hypothetical protein
MFGLQEARTEHDLGGLIETAEGLIAEGKGEATLDVGRDVPYTAATFVSMFGDPTKTDVFPFRFGRDGDYGRLASITSPMLVTYGDVEEAVNVPVEDAAALMKEMATASPHVDAVIVHGGNHVYWGHEEELANAIAAFVEP